jgi:hypothetical protein
VKQERSNNRSVDGGSAREAAQNALADEYSSISDGFVLVITIIFGTIPWTGWPFGSRRSKNSSTIHPFTGEERPFIMAEYAPWLITEKELMSMLRQQGVDDLAEVKEAFMEGDGRISVVTKNGKSKGGESNRERKL